MGPAEHVVDAPVRPRSSVADAITTLHGSHRALAPLANNILVTTGSEAVGQVLVAQREPVERLRVGGGGGVVVVVVSSAPRFLLPLLLLLLLLLPILLPVCPPQRTTHPA